MKMFALIAAVLFSGACLAPQTSDVTGTQDAQESLMSIDDSDAFQVDDDESCNCPAIRCDGKTKAAACEVSCSAGQNPVCMCGDCAYGSFNRCTCIS